MESVCCCDLQAFASKENLVKHKKENNEKLRRTRENGILKIERMAKNRRSSLTHASYC